MLKLPEKLSNLLPLKDVIKSFHLSPNKGLGQNFLTDSFITDQVVLSAGDLTGQTVLEVGPGPGGLTRSLLASPAEKIYAIEMDSRCIEALKQLQDLSDNRLQLIHGDALSFKLEEIHSPKLSIVANLPYNIGTMLVMNWLKQLDRINCITVMLQKEVVERFIAKPSTGQYGKISVLTQWLCNSESCFDIEPDFFFPPPKITSSVLRLIPHTSRIPAEYRTLEKVCNCAFKKRRKMLRSSLVGLPRSPEEIADACQIDLTKRAEDLTVAEFCQIANFLDNKA